MIFNTTKDNNISLQIAKNSNHTLIHRACVVYVKFLFLTFSLSGIFEHKFKARMYHVIILHSFTTHHDQSEVPSFTRFRHILRAAKFESGYVTMTMPFRGLLVNRRLVLAMADLQNKFEDCRLRCSKV